MPKKKSDPSNHHSTGVGPSEGAAEHDGGTQPELTRKEYEKQMRILHGELVAMQEWVKASGAKICIVFEGRDTAGKGGTIKRITERVSPRVFRVIALTAPTEREKSQMYIQRYIPHLPAAGEVVIFDRSWYNRAGVERVMGFCTPEETDRFLSQVPAAEKTMVDSGIRLLKYWLEVTADEQTRRLESRIHDPRKIWKLTDMDLKSYSRWYDYARARDAMFAATDTAWAPWYVADTNDKKARAAQYHQPPSQPGTLRTPPQSGRQATQASGCRWLRRPQPAVAAHSDPVLTGRKIAPRWSERASRRARDVERTTDRRAGHGDRPSHVPRRLQRGSTAGAGGAGTITGTGHVLGRPHRFRSGDAARPPRGRRRIAVPEADRACAGPGRHYRADQAPARGDREGARRRFGDVQRLAPVPLGEDR